MTNFILVVILFGYFSTLFCSENRNYIVYWDRFEDVPSREHTLFDYSKIRIIRREKVRYLNGTFTVTDDVDNSYQVGMRTFHSARSDSQFIMQPYQFIPTPVCIFLNTTFRKFTDPIIRVNTNFPIIPPEGLCPLPKGKYHIKDAELVFDNFPAHLRSGLWKLEISILDLKNKYHGGFFMYVKIEQKI